jgi:hypothetical protein
MVKDAYLSTAAAVGRLLRSPELAQRWDSPSALAEFSVRGLAGHLARAVFTTDAYLSAEVPPGATMTDAADYVARALGAGTADLATPLNTSIRDRGEEDAAGGPADLADRYDDALSRVAARIADLREEHPVFTGGRLVLPLRECLVTRLIELVVHADDLAVSLGVTTPDVDPEAADLVLTALVRISRRRHGTLPVLRALSRSERSTGPIAAF